MTPEGVTGHASGEQAVGPVASPTRWISTAEAARLLGIDRSTLDGMVARCPRTLAGGPTHVGAGRVRRHLRWDATKLDVWMAAYRDWQAMRGRTRR